MSIDVVEVVIWRLCSGRRRHTGFDCVWSSDVCSSDLKATFGFVSKYLNGATTSSGSAGLQFSGPLLGLGVAVRRRGTIQILGHEAERRLAGEARVGGV